MLCFTVLWELVLQCEVMAPPAQLDSCVRRPPNPLWYWLPSPAVREERRALPWPFVCPAAPPLSPQRLASSPCSRSPSVGSSPSRAPLRPAPAPSPAPGGYRGQAPLPPLIDNCRAKRTRLVWRTQGLPILSVYSFFFFK